MNKPTHDITRHLTDQQIAELEAIAAKRGCSAEEAVVAALDAYILRETGQLN